MKKVAKAIFEIKDWDEKPFGDLPGAPKITCASVRKAYAGELDGEGELQYLMAYGDDGSARFVGIERFVGRVGDARGNFVFQHIGSFRDGVAESVWSVVPNSGTAGLKGLRGEVRSALGHAKSYPVELHYDLA